MDMKRFFLYAIVIAALALAGCGSDGNGGMVDNGMPDPTPDPMCPEGQVGTPPNCAPPGPTPEEVAAATKAAETKDKAIMEAVAPTAVDAGLGGNAGVGPDGTPGNTDDTYSLAIDRTGSGMTVKITDSGMAGDDDPKFSQQADLMGGRTMHVRQNDDGSEEVVIVATDVEAAKPVAFAKFESADGLTPQALTVDAEGTTATGDAAVAFDPGGELTVAANEAMLDNIKSASFAPPTDGSSSVERSFLPADEGDDDTPAREAAMVAGTYNGAMGTYTCSGNTSCTVTVNDKGELTAASDGWIFTPAAGATSNQPDYAYLAYGVWLKKTTKDGATTYNEVEAFFEPGGGGLAQTDASTLQAVTGTADYVGGSTGVYVKDGADNSKTSGHYSAEVNLQATFGGGNVGVNQQYRVDGEVTNFVLSNGEENDWSVKLESADFSGRAADALEGPAGSNHSSTFSGMTTGDSRAARGNWNGAFFGVATGPDGPDAGRDPDPVAPSDIGGEFNANFDDGSVLGGFGTHKQ